MKKTNVKKKKTTRVRKTKNNFWGCSSKPNKKNFWVFAGIVAIILVCAIAYGLLKTKGAGVLFTQSDWSGLASTDAADITVSPNATDWTKYSSAIGLETTSSGIQLAGTVEGWMEGGVPVNSQGRQEPSNFVFAGSGNDETFVTWVDELSNAASLQKIDINGTALWSNDTPNPTDSGGNLAGIIINSNGGGYEPKVAKLGSGVVVFYAKDIGSGNYKLYAKKINLDTGVTDWDIAVSDSPLMGGASSGPSPDLFNVVDTGDGVIAFWIGTSGTNDVQARKINSSGIDLLFNSGNVVSVSSTDQVGRVYAMKDSDRGAFVAWYSSGGSGKIYVNKIDNVGSVLGSDVIIRDGNITNSSSHSNNPFIIISDNQTTNMGAIIAWQENRSGDVGIYGQRVNVNGSAIAKIWSNDNNGIAIVDLTGDQSNPSMSLIDSNHVLIAWDDARSTPKQIFYKKLNISDGSLVSGWPTDGYQLSNLSTDSQRPKVETDGHDGAFIFYDNEQGAEFLGQRIDSDGTIYAGWPADGRIFSSIDRETRSSIKYNSTVNNLFVDWSYKENTNPGVFVQKVGVGQVFYSSLGGLTSSIFNAGPQTNWESLIWGDQLTGLLPGTSISFKTRTAIGNPENIAKTASNIYAKTFLNVGAPTGGSPSSAIDDSDATDWIHDFMSDPLAPSSPQWIAVDLGLEKTFKNIRIQGTEMDPANILMITAYQVLVPKPGVTPTLTPGSDLVLSEWDTPIATDADAAPHTNPIVDQITLTAPITTHYIAILITDANPLPFLGGAKICAISDLSLSEYSWSDTDPSGWTDLGPAGQINSPVGQYIQYQVTLIADNGRSHTPTISSVTISGSPVASPSPPSQISPPTYSPEEKGEANQTPQEEANEIPQPIAQPLVCSNTLAEVQASPIPEFNPAWGLDFPLGDRATWALYHRAAIYQLYLDLLGRAPCATEVNGWLQYSDDINLIRYLFLTSDEYKSKN